MRVNERAECEVQTCKRNTLTELVYEQLMQSFSAADLAAFLIALVFTKLLDEGEVTGMGDFFMQAQQVVRTCGKLEAAIRSIGQVKMDFCVDSIASLA